jgi:hypothetical protein
LQEFLLDLPSDFPPELYVFGSFNVVRFDFFRFFIPSAPVLLQSYIVTLNKAILSTSDIYQKPEHHMVVDRRNHMRRAEKFSG